MTIENKHCNTSGTQYNPLDMDVIKGSLPPFYLKLINFAVISPVNCSGHITNNQYNDQC
jgi:hypothetical protein